MKHFWAELLKLRDFFALGAIYNIAPYFDLLRVPYPAQKINNNFQKCIYSPVIIASEQKTYVIGIGTWESAKSAAKDIGGMKTLA